MHTQTDTLTQIRQHLTSKSAGELVDLLMDLLQQTDETTRRRFWEQLAPSGLATADLRYSSPEAFLADVEMFVVAAAIVGRTPVTFSATFTLPPTGIYADMHVVTAQVATCLLFADLPIR
jgi:hypothetical protein